MKKIPEPTRQAWVFVILFAVYALTLLSCGGDMRKFTVLNVAMHIVTLIAIARHVKNKPQPKKES